MGFPKPSKGGGRRNRGTIREASPEIVIVGPSPTIRVGSASEQNETSNVAGDELEEFQESIEVKPLDYYQNMHVNHPTERLTITRSQLKAGLTGKDSAVVSNRENDLEPKSSTFIHDRSLQTYEGVWALIFKAWGRNMEPTHPQTAVHVSSEGGRWRLDFKDDDPLEVAKMPHEAIEDTEARRMAISERAQSVLAGVLQNPANVQNGLSGSDWDRILKSIYDCCSAIDRKLVPLLARMARCRIVIWPRAFEALVLRCCQAVWKVQMTDIWSEHEGWVQEHEKYFPSGSRPWPDRRVYQKDLKGRIEETKAHHDTCKRIESAFIGALRGLKKDDTDGGFRPQTKERHFYWNGRLVLIDTMTADGQPVKENSMDQEVAKDIKRDVDEDLITRDVGPLMEVEY